MLNKKKILVVAGDPNSVNSEIIYKCWNKLNKPTKRKLILIGNYKLLKQQFKQLKYKINLSKVNSINQITKKENLKIINVDLKYKDPFKVNKFKASTYVKKCLEIGHLLAINKRSVCGLINCAIDKNLLPNKTGVTEYLADKCKVSDKSEVMMIKGQNFSVCPITTHIEIKQVSKKIKSKTIITKVKTIQKFFKEYFKKKPKIGILGLNPHNAEYRPDSEEVKEIIPAIKKLNKIGYKVNGPLVSDTIFMKEYKKYDLLVGMYHDQVLAPFKSIFKFNAINVTLGLKYLRASPDHGTAINLIKKKKANPKSLIECIKFINKFI